MNTLVSVVIPCYNYGRFLTEAVASVLAQTYQRFEIIIVDDHSTDNTQEIAAALVEQYPEKIRYFRHAFNVKQSRNRNKGVELARGDLVAFLDADDIWNKEYLTRTVSLFTKPEIGLAYCYKGEFEDGNPIRVTEHAHHQKCVHGYVIDDLFVSNFIGNPFVIRKSILEEIGGFDPSFLIEFNHLGADWWLTLNVAVKYEVECARTILYYYRMHETQISGNVQRRIVADQRTRELFLEKYPNVISKKAQRQAMIWQHTCEGYYYRSIGKQLNSLKGYFKALLKSPFSFNLYKASILTAIGR